MTFAGSFGVPRRHWDISFSQAPFDVQFSPAVDLVLGIMALGGMLARDRRRIATSSSPSRPSSSGSHWWPATPRVCRRASTHRSRRRANVDVENERLHGVESGAMGPAPGTLVLVLRGIHHVLFRELEVALGGMEGGMSASRGARLAVAALAAMATTVVWWSLALWPVRLTAPSGWCARGRSASAWCCGRLPNAGGWVLLVSQPLTVMISAVWRRCGKASRQCARRAPDGRR